MHGFGRQFSPHFHKTREVRHKSATEMKKQQFHLNDHAATARQA